MPSSSAGDSSAVERDETNSKVGRLIDEYDLDGLGTELADRWTATGDERASLRDLADVFNRRLLEATLRAADVETLDGEVENTYRLLTSDDVTTGVRTEARNALEREGVDVGTLETEFVSHQAIHTFLTKYRGVTREQRTLEPDERIERELQTLRRLQNRTVAVTENAIDRLSDTPDLSIGETDVLVDVRVFCRECGSDYTVEELFEAGGCRCDDDEASTTDSDDYQ